MLKNFNLKQYYISVTATEVLMQILICMLSEMEMLVLELNLYFKC